ncbi:MAG TPA: DUF4870 domain-containing protein [Steroidobacteraceae bacterium]|nr:DUF4870 domain-containing protein [Steroidobacteraceae bacterium]
MNESSKPVASVPTQDERTWGMIAHLSAFAVFVFPLFGNVLAPLIIWLARRDTSAFVEMEAKEALNFNISVALAGIICGLLTFVLIGIPLGTLVFLGWVVLTIIAGIKASEGIGYRYPLSLRFVK